MKVASQSFENVATFKYLETIVMYKNYVHKEVKSRLNSGKA
jgi:hypothetical protein